MTTCQWFWGRTGVGKSHAIYKDYHPTTHYLWKNNNGFWDGYTGQKYVIMNDFRGEIPYNELLQIIDKWPYKVNIKYREPRQFVSEHVFITSSLPPGLVYNRRVVEDSIEQLLRRVEVIEVTPPPPTPLLAIEDVAFFDVLD